MSDPILSLRWLGTEPDPYWLDARENDGVPLTVRAFNGVFRYVRLELFNADLDPPGPHPDSFASPPLPVNLDAGDPASEWILTEMLGLNQHVSARDPLIGLGFLPEFGAGKKDVPLDGYGWVKRYRLEVVGYSTLDRDGLEAPFRYRRVSQTAGIDLTTWEALKLATLITQVIEPIFGIFLGHSRTTFQLVVLVGIAAWQVMRANNMDTNSVASVGQAVVTVIKNSLDPTNTSPIFRRVRDALLGAGGGLVGNAIVNRLLKVVSGLGLVFDVVTLAGVALAMSSLGQVRTRHDLIISTAANETLVRVTPPELSREVTEQFGVNLFLTWTVPPDIGMPLPKTTTVDTATETLVARASKMGTDIVLYDLARAGGATNAGLPLGIKFRPHQGAESLVHAEAWNPRLGDTGVAVTFNQNLFPLYVGDSVGTGQLEIMVSNLELGQLGIDATPDLFTGVPLDVRLARPTVTVLPRLEVQVGERDRHQVSVSLTTIQRAQAPHFDSATQFIGSVQIADDGMWMRVRELEVYAPNRWSGEQELQKLPFTVLFEQDGVDDQALVLFKEPESDEVYTDRTEHFVSLGDYILGRRSGTATVSVTVEINDPQRFRAPEGPTSFLVDVLPTLLDLAVTPAEDPQGDGTLVLEDRFVDGRLLGSFHLAVRARGTLLYDSDVPAQLRGRVSANRLLIEDVFVEDEVGDLHQLPFRIQATIDDTSVAEFFIPEGVPAGTEDQFHYWGTLEDLVSATGPGTTTITVSLLEPDVPLTDDQVYYDMPDPATLTVEVPPPLVAHLWFWEDGYFADPNFLDLSASDAPGSRPRMADLIYAHGEVAGGVDHHNPLSEHEEITLRIDPPGSSQQDIDLLNAGAVGDNGDWVHDVEGLRVGDNVIRLRAWKPINDIVNGGPSIAECILPGVQPRFLQVLVQDVGPSVVFDGNPDGGPLPPTSSRDEDRIVVKRSLTDVEVRYSRAIWARLIDDAVPLDGGLHFPNPFEETDAPRHALAPDYELAYEQRTINTGLLTNALSTGAPVAHQIKVLAWNEYVDDQTVDYVSSSVTLFAPAPTPVVEATEPNGPFRDQNHVGNSTTAVDVTISVGMVPRMEVRDDNGTLIDSTDFSNPFSTPDQQLRIPPNGSLALGWNRFQIEAMNEFKTDRIDLEIHRRALIFETLNGFTELRTDGSDVDIKVQVRESGDMSVPLDADDPVFGIWNRTANGESSSPSLGWSSLLFRLVTLDDDGVPHHESGPTRITLDGEITGPDYERFDPVLLVPNGWVDAGNENNNPAPYTAPSGQQYWFRVVLDSRNAGRTIVWTVMPPDGNPAQGI